MLLIFSWADGVLLCNPLCVCEKKNPKNQMDLCKFPRFYRLSIWRMHSFDQKAPQKTTKCPPCQVNSFFDNVSFFPCVHRKIFVYETVFWSDRCRYFSPEMRQT